MKQGDKVQLLPEAELLEMFNHHQFFSEDYRHKCAGYLGGKKGTVERIYPHWDSYFYFKPEDQELMAHYVPMQSIASITPLGSERKWHSQSHRPPLDKDSHLSFSESVLIYSPLLEMHSIGWFDFEQDKWNHTGEEAMDDFIWTALTDLTPTPDA